MEAIIIGLVLILLMILVHQPWKQKETRIVEITMESGIKRYRCERKLGKNSWITMNEGYAVFSTKDAALKFLGKHPDQIIVKEKIL